MIAAAPTPTNNGPVPPAQSNTGIAIPLNFPLPPGNVHHDPANGYMSIDFDFIVRNDSPADAPGPAGNANDSVNPRHTPGNSAHPQAGHGNFNEHAAFPPLPLEGYAMSLPIDTTNVPSGEETETLDIHLDINDFGPFAVPEDGIYCLVIVLFSIFHFCNLQISRRKHLFPRPTHLLEMRTLTIQAAPELSLETTFLSNLQTLPMYYPTLPHSGDPRLTDPARRLLVLINSPVPTMRPILMQIPMQIPIEERLIFFLVTLLRCSVLLFLVLREQVVLVLRLLLAGVALVIESGGRGPPHQHPG